ncbi:MAG: hypothetical protein FWD17_14525, partial [Polyangiaceae bacterium]|nr:hypothetical protein [Polyangiaceae bacterium]
STNGKAAVGPAKTETTSTQLIGDFTAMVEGVGIWGCGIESQLESWYRFLVQPDPYASLQASGGGVAPKDMWVDVDWEILKERHDFLRPDSLVAVIVLTDENDSEIDVRSLGGQGYFFMNAAPVNGFDPPKGTSACASDPGSPSCQSCSNMAAAGDPACASPNTYSALNDWGYDPNLRHVHMKAKYGLDPQYPVGRYVLGLKNTAIPDRFGEYQDDKGNPVANYVGTPDCTNPLYAQNLPDGSDHTVDICHLDVGVRTSNLVFYAIIGGVPNQLLHFDPNSTANSTLSEADWVRILGQGPAGLKATDTPNDMNHGYDYTGIDPHMIEDYRDRTTVNYPFSTDSSLTNPLVPANSGQTDKVNGREWVTDLPAPTYPPIPGAHVLNVDREYACTFPLAQPRDCTAAANQNACDCPPATGGLTPDQVPPLCNPNTPTQQIAAKAYPTVRELMVAHMMGPQGIAASLCPIDVMDNSAKNDPLYGYRPAVAAIINRLKTQLNTACLPYKLQIDPNNGTVPCLVLVAMPADLTGATSCMNPGAACDPSLGLSVPQDMSVLQHFCDQQENAWRAAGQEGTEPAKQPVCQLQELVNGPDPMLYGVVGDPNNFDSTGQCSTASKQPGWCYAENAKGCAESIEFATGSPPKGGTAALQCIFANSDGGM